MRQNIFDALTVGSYVWVDGLYHSSIILIWKKSYRIAEFTVDYTSDNQPYNRNCYLVNANGEYLTDNFLPGELSPLTHYDLYYSDLHPDLIIRYDPGFTYGQVYNELCDSGIYGGGDIVNGVTYSRDIKTLKIEIEPVNEFNPKVLIFYRIVLTSYSK